MCSITGILRANSEYRNLTMDLFFVRVGIKLLLDLRFLLALLIFLNLFISFSFRFLFIMKHFIR